MKVFNTMQMVVTGCIVENFNSYLLKFGFRSIHGCCEYKISYAEEKRVSHQHKKY